jgi:hypothetical protein
MEFLRYGFTSLPFPHHPSPGVIGGEDFGDRNDLDNVFHWESLNISSSGKVEYDPIKPWVKKQRECDGKIATECLVYVDDLRPTGPSEEEYWRATRWVACQINHHGLKDAAQKRRRGAHFGGPWDGTVVHTTNNMVDVMVTEKR